MTIRTRRKTILLSWLAAALLCAAPAHGQVARAARAIPAQDLAGALSQLAQDTNIELLFDRRAAAGRNAPAVAAGAPVEQALSRLLAGSGFTYRRLGAGSYVIQGRPAPGGAAGGAAKAVPPPVTEVAELLVAGKRTLNSDIRRSIDDIQPYQVFDARSLETSQSRDLEDFLRSQTGARALDPTLSQSPANSFGSAQSQIDLRGLGADQTVVLVDGRRLPANPSSGLNLPIFAQSDVNALSPGDIDRIEVLGLSAGGIFGVGAAGGAVNIVLKREFEGAEARATSGVSSRGDAWRWEAAGRVGFSIPGAETRLMLSVAHAEDDGLEFGDRDFVVEARRRRAAQTPNPRQAAASPSINFASQNGQPLTLIDSLGGASLGATTTFLPLDAPAMDAGGAALLLANAGLYDIRLSPDGQGERQSLLTPNRTTSILATLRQTIGPKVEVYLDGLWMANDGRANVPALDTESYVLNSTARNPFKQTVTVTYPTPGLVGKTWTDAETYRVSAGLIGRLGGGWTLNLDAATGRSTVRVGLDEVAGGFFNPLQGGPGLAAHLAQLQVRPSMRQRNVSRLDDVTVRAAGPLARLPAGPLTVTATAEWRREGQDAIDEAMDGRPEERAAVNRRTVGSLFFEARTPVFGEDAPVGLLRKLDLQLALRGDRYAIGLPRVDLSALTGGLSDEKNRASILATTFGARVEPLDGLALRASVSTGATPPTPAMLVEGFFEDAGVFLIDPKRGGAPSLSFVDVALGGSASLRPQRTTTVSLGLIAQPPAVPGLRVSIDYSRLRTVDEIGAFALIDVQYFVDHEGAYPDRVARGALTPADAALGYTAGPITGIDTRMLQVGRSTLQVVDFAVDYRRAMSANDLHFYARATWTPSFRRRWAPDQETFDLAGHPDGPLRWRGVLGAAWTRGTWSSTIGVQVYGPSSGYLATPPTYLERATLGDFGPVEGDGANATRIPPQVYVDWSMAWRPPRRDGRPALEYRVGIRNLLDAEPPTVAGSVQERAMLTGGGVYDYDPLGGYSPMGDARGRRFEVAIVSRF